MQLLQHFKELTIRPKNAKELKGLILQLAIQGKLTSKWRKENPDVEVSTDLLKRIKDYNSEQLKLNKRRVSIPKGEIKELNYLPKGWVKVVNYELFNLQKGKNPKDLSETVKKYIYQDIASLDRGNVRRYSDDEKAPKCKETDILVVCDGSRSGLILDGKPGVVGSTLAIIHTPPFIKDYIKLIFLQDFERANANMIGAAIPHLNTKGLLLTSIGLPPLEEQKEIVNVVEILFKEVEQLEKLTVKRIGLKEDFVTSALHQLTTNKAKQEWNYLQDHFKSFFNETNNIKKLRETVLQLAVQGKLTADWRANNPNIKNASANLELIKSERELQLVKENEIPFKLNSTWEWAKFIDVAKLRHGHQFRNYDFVEEGIPVIKIGQCKPDGTLDLSKCNYIDSSRKDEFENDLIFKGHLLMALTGGTLGKVTRVDIDYGILVQNYRVGNFFADERVITLDFLNLILESELFQSLVREKINQNAQPNIGKDSIEKIVMPIPPLEEQKAIVKKVNALLGLCDALAQEVQQSQEHSEQLMQSVLREVFSN